MAKLLVKVRGNGKRLGASAGRAMGAAGVDITPIMTVPADRSTSAGAGLAAAEPSTWLRISGVATSENAWDAAHELLSRNIAGSEIEAIEPDIVQQWPQEATGPDLGFAAAGGVIGPDASGGQAVGTPATWHLASDFSQLRDASKKVGDKQRKVRIAHLDTGYDPHHVTLPVNLRTDLAANFADDKEAGSDAEDPPPPTIHLLNNHGHGTGTLSLLAGRELDGTVPGLKGFTDPLGGAPLAEVIPIRIADSVVRFTTGTIVQGIEHALANDAHVLSMSMGGLGSNALADAVNKAYDAGLVMVTAAGNNYAGVPSPKSIVFPARFLRVLAACGVMADGRAYAGLSFKTMQGNYGPPEKMAAALGAYTPNVPWARIATKNLVRLNGAGTSSATPQIAAAAALWIAKHWDAVMDYPEPWMRVEAVRRALFESARTITPGMSVDETRQKIGRGALRAYDALAFAPADASELKKLAPAQPSWTWLDLLTGEGGVSLARRRTKEDARRAMLNLELTQMTQLVPEVDAANAAFDGASPAARSRYLEAVLESGKPSKALRQHLEKMLPSAVSAKAKAKPNGPPPPNGGATPGEGQSGGGGGPAPPAQPRRKSQLASRIRPPDAPPRRLRVYALDPTLAKMLETAPINVTTLSVPWDDRNNRDQKSAFTQELRPGPVGEYIEVVDIDPASGKIYEPVDLNEKFLLAQDGLSPSEGNPKFHQQMVYAVATTTIQNFESALGRKAQWARHTIRYREKGKEKTFSQYVPRLRIYPHALRTANAYYSPDKKALLFGYFKADSREEDATAPGTVVFTCLSSDVIAHETAHALLDGLHRGYQEASNPDVPAFHEAFADIVALFQHFMIPELVTFSISNTGADLAASDLLAGLAKQFGEGTNIGGALRNYVSPETDRLRYTDDLEVHDRGAILVRAVYDAFIAVVTNRTRDLLRIATGGSGILPDGALHPDLVNRLTTETCKTARHFMRICVRALDYCPCVDITFGDYLRAIITSDSDAVQDDRCGYRIAIMQAFRRRGIIPHDVLTMSAEALTWNVASAGLDEPQWLKDFLDGADFGLNRRLTRYEIYAREEANRWKLWHTLRSYFRKLTTPDERTAAMGDFGLEPGIPRYSETGELLREARDGETTFEVRSVRTARRGHSNGTFRTDIIAVIQQRKWIYFDREHPEEGGFWFRGGATLIIQQSHDRFVVPLPVAETDDEETSPTASRPPQGFIGHVQYVVTKNSSSDRRLKIANETMRLADGTTRALYFGSANREPFAMMHDEARGHDHG